ncbi:hypothetical protein F4861DRAFT_489438 [Xylaria intraflava]|nr:hypothetical protein F4861DRAFT_489438 [Xylaria intraflava]
MDNSAWESFQFPMPVSFPIFPFPCRRDGNPRPSEHPDNLPIHRHGVFPTYAMRVGLFPPRRGSARGCVWRQARTRRSMEPSARSGIPLTRSDSSTRPSLPGGALALGCWDYLHATAVTSSAGLRYPVRWVRCHFVSRQRPWRADSYVPIGLGGLPEGVSQGRRWDGAGLLLAIRERHSRLRPLTISFPCRSWVGKWIVISADVQIYKCMFRRDHDSPSDPANARGHMTVAIASLVEKSPCLSLPGYGRSRALSRFTSVPAHCRPSVRCIMARLTDMRWVCKDHFQACSPHSRSIP